MISHVSPGSLASHRCLSTVTLCVTPHLHFQPISPSIGTHPGARSAKILPRLAVRCDTYQSDVTPPGPTPAVRDTRLTTRRCPQI